MEAEVFMQVSEALEACEQSFSLAVAYPPGIDKIVWSVWDYVMGPELRFCWEVVADELPTPSDVSRAGSEASSGGLAFDDIDAPFAGQLLTAAADVHVCGRCLGAHCSGGDSCHLADDEQGFGGADDAATMTDSQSTLCSGSAPADDLPLDAGGLSQLRLSLHASDSGVEDEDVAGPSDEGSPEMSRCEAAAADGRKTSTAASADSSVTDAPVSDLATSSADTSKEDAAEEESSPPVVSSDEQFVAAHALSSEICRGRVADSLFEAKVLRVPERRLLVGAFVFAARHRDNQRAVHAVSLLLHESRAAWLMRRFDWFRRYFVDATPRLKAALLVVRRARRRRTSPRLQESRDELLCRMTTEWSQLLKLVGMLERWPLDSLKPKIQHTFLAGPKLAQDVFVQRAVSGFLQAQCSAVIVSASQKRALKMLCTLLLFLDDADRWCCLQPFASSSYCAYLKLQAVSESQLTCVRAQAAQSWWPVCVVDVDKCTVCLSPGFVQHRSARRDIHLSDLRRVLQMEDSRSRALLDLRPIGGATELMVKNWVQRMALLPYDNTIREGFVNQFRHYLAQKAFALVVYAQESSSFGEKPEELSVSRMRKALDLQSENTFWTVVAQAELMKPGLCQLLFPTI